mmetsp:Transcript_11488/g.34621  ORF Transcript_11488/g.34621 Transcript_11488/m.34621 type:complete len:473 (-) Transcript_11488:182-1600(-)
MSNRCQHNRSLEAGGCCNVQCRKSHQTVHGDVELALTGTVPRLGNHKMDEIRSWRPGLNGVDQLVSVPLRLENRPERSCGRVELVVDRRELCGFHGTASWSEARVGDPLKANIVDNRGTSTIDPRQIKCRRRRDSDAVCGRGLSPGLHKVNFDYPIVSNGYRGALDHRCLKANLGNQVDAGVRCCTVDEYVGDALAGRVPILDHVQVNNVRPVGDHRDLIHDGGGVALGVKDGGKFVKIAAERIVHRDKVCGGDRLAASTVCCVGLPLVTIAVRHRWTTAIDTNNVTSGVPWLSRRAVDSLAENKAVHGGRLDRPGRGQRQLDGCRARCERRHLQHPDPRCLEAILDHQVDRAQDSDAIDRDVKDTGPGGGMPRLDSEQVDAVSVCWSRRGNRERIHTVAIALGFKDSSHRGGVSRVCERHVDPIGRGNCVAARCHAAVTSPQVAVVVYNKPVVPAVDAVQYSLHLCLRRRN